MACGRTFLGSTITTSDGARTFTFPARATRHRSRPSTPGDGVGILHGGSVYGCVFTGGAAYDLFTFARLWPPSGAGVLGVLSSVVVLTWVVVKSLDLTTIELLRTLPRVIAHPANTRAEGRWLAIKVGLSVWVRELFTLAVSRDLYAGVPAVYVNYLDYDVAGHAFGPHSRRALRMLTRVDDRAGTSGGCSSESPNTNTTSTSCPITARHTVSATRS